MWRQGTFLVTALTALGTAAVATLQAFGLLAIPEALEPLRERVPLGLPVHMGFGGAALALIVAVLATRRRPALHRRLGRAAVASVLVGGLSAVPTALASGVGAFGQTGFVVQGVLWIGLLAIGVGAIRRGRIGVHRRAMLLMASVAIGAVVLRLVLAALQAAGLDPNRWYEAVVWLAWLVPLALVSGVTRTDGGHRQPPGPGRRPTRGDGEAGFILLFGSWKPSAGRP